MLDVGPWGGIGVSLMPVVLDESSLGSMLD